MARYEMRLDTTHRSLHAPAETVWLSQLDGDVTTGNLKGWRVEETSEQLHKKWVSRWRIGTQAWVKFDKRMASSLQSDLQHAIQELDGDRINLQKLVILTSQSVTALSQIITTYLTYNFSVLLLLSLLLVLCSALLIVRLSDSSIASRLRIPIENNLFKSIHSILLKYALLNQMRPLTDPPFALSSATSGEVNSSIIVSFTSAFSSLKPMRL